MATRKGSAKTSSVYERELKEILNADSQILEKVTKTCDYLERANYKKIKEKPFVVIRAGASLGMDLVALRGDMSFPIEVKASSKKLLHFSQGSGRANKQAEDMLETCNRSGLLPIYALRLKGERGDSWRIYTLDGAEVEGTLRTLHRRLPKVATSKEGNYILRWDDGMPLNTFIEYVC